MSQPLTLPTDTANPETGGAPLLCLYAANPEAKARIADEPNAALLQLQQQHPDWNAAFGAGGTPAIAGECEVTLPATPLDRATVVGPGLVEAPGPWYAVVVALDEAQAGPLLGDVSALSVPYERISEDDGARAVTTALVMRDGTFQDAQTLRELALTLRLDPARLPALP